MFSASEFHDIVSGRRRGLGADALRAGLLAGAWIYAGAVRWRNRRYDRGAARIHRVDVPVVSVGNLTLGGTGKTPMVAWLARWFGDHGVRVAVVSRGYGSRPGEANDEALELRRDLPNVPHLQNPDRVAAAREAVAATGCGAIILDDGFQHRRIARDLDIVLLDALEPFGFGHLFPRGLLRELVEGLRRADVVILSRADLLDPARREAIWQVVRPHAPNAVLAEAAHVAKRLFAADGQESPLDSARDRPVAAFCGIGNPTAFRRTLDACGCRVAGFREFPDHHRYTPADLDALAAWARELEAEIVLCTGKDLAKLSVNRLGDCPLRAVGIELALSTGQDRLELRLRALTPAARSLPRS
jgi:tetraacyldisaccharide 4'-kinase